MQLQFNSVSWFLLPLLLLIEVDLCMSQADGKSAVLNYVNQHLAKGEVGYGWEDQPDRHLTPTFAAVGILYHLNALPEDTRPLIEWVRTHHPQDNSDNREAGPSGSEIRDLIYQQVKSLIWLGDNVSDFESKVANWESQQGHWANFELKGYPPLLQEMMTPVVRNLLDMPKDPDVRNYLEERRRANGSFNNAPVREGGDGNILNTFWGVYGWMLINESIDGIEEIVAWLQACQTENGGFTHQPDPQIGVNDEVVYTWAAVKTLEKLSAEPDDKNAVTRYLLSLQNSDGGFGNRPGLPSTPMSTFYAIDALQTLGKLSQLELERVKPQQTEQNASGNYSDYNIYTVQFQAPGKGSLNEALTLADSLGIDLWGAKNADTEWVQTAQKMADEYGIPVHFFHSNEDYSKHVTVEGMGTFNHVFDQIYPFERGAETPTNWTLDQENIFSWDSFADDYVHPLFNDHGALLWQVNYNEPLTRLLLDHSINEKSFYVAISTVHFNQNFLFWSPFLYQHRYQLPFISLQDFHGGESWWWGNELVHYRNLFLAKEPTYEAMLEALRNQRVVTVRHDELTGYSTRILGGAPGVQDYILSRQNEWKWWGSEADELNHPWASIVVVKPDDRFEEGRPETGVNIRIRCWWEGPRETLRKQVVGLTRLTVNGREVKTDYIESEDQQGDRTDVYYLYSWPDIEPGEYRIEATVRHKRRETERVISIPFEFKR